MNGKYSTDSPWIVDTTGKKISGIVNPDGSQSSLAYMGTNLPDIIAEETLYPYRVLMPGANAFGALAATTDGDTLLGVTDGTVRTTGASQHALSGEVVRLQQGDFVQVTAGGTIVASDLLIPTNEGKVIAYTGSSATCLLQAMQAGSDGTVIWCKKVAAVGIGGGVSPITGGGWPDASAKALWSCEFTGAVPRFLFPPATTGTNYPAGPDYYWWNDNPSAVGGTVDAASSGGLGGGRVGIHETTVLCTDNTAHWLRLGMLPSPDWNASSAGGFPGGVIRYNAHEFVMMVYVATGAMPASYPGSTIIVGAISDKVTTASGQYWIDDNTGGSCGFYFKLDIATSVWTCVSRLRDRTAGFAETATTVTGSLTGWINFKIEITPHPTDPVANRPTVKWYANGTLQRTLDLNTETAGYTSWLASLTTGPQIGMREAANAFSYSTMWVDYMHLLTTFTTPR